MSMQRIAAMTVVRGRGGCEAFFEGVVREEMRAQRRSMEAAENRHNRQLAHRLALIRRQERTKKSVLERIAGAWELVAGTVICWGEALGLWVWEEVDDDD